MRVELPGRASGAVDRLSTWSSNNQELSLGLLVALGAGIYLFGIPGWVSTIALGLFYGIVPSVLVGGYIVKRFFPDDRHEIIELNPSNESDQTEAKSWLVPRDVWDNRKQGERSCYADIQGAEAIVSELEPMEDINRIRVEGCNEELADPVSTITRDGKLDKIYGDLIERAEERDKIVATVRADALEMQRSITHDIMAAVESGTAMEPGSIEESLSNIDMDTQLSPSDDQDQTQHTPIDPDESELDGPAVISMSDLMDQRATGDDD
jgi:hypothetical protein